MGFLPMEEAFYPKRGGGKKRKQGLKEDSMGKGKRGRKILSRKHEEP